jgi:hypothetical protein
MAGNHLTRAAEALASAEAHEADARANYIMAANELAAHKAETGESNATIAAQLPHGQRGPRSATWVGNLLRWRDEDFEAPTPNLRDPEHHTGSDNSKAKRVLRERPEVVVGYLRELPAEQQAAFARSLAEAAPAVVAKGIAAATPSARATVHAHVDRELRYPGLSDAEVERARQLEHRNREEVRAKLAPVMGALATLGATGIVEAFEQLLDQLRSSVEQGATFDEDQLARLGRVSVGVQDEVAVLRERLAMAAL